MQIAEKWQLPPFKLGMRADEEAIVELRSSRLAGQSSASFSVARESTSTSSE